MLPAYPEAMQTFSFTRFMHILIISVLLLRPQTRVFDVCLAICYSFVPGKCCVPFFRYVVKPWNCTDRRSISTPSCVSQSFCLLLHHIIFGGVTRWNRLKLVEAAHTHTHTHCIVRFFWNGWAKAGCCISAIVKELAVKPFRREDWGTFLAFYTAAVQNVCSLRKLLDGDDEEKENL